MTKRLTALLLVCVIGFSAPVWAAKKKKPKASAKPFDYYLLTLSWAPAYCALHPGDGTAECADGNHTGFVVHGLWPQGERGEGPPCHADGQKVTAAIVAATLSYIPTKSLMQHEWDHHGACSGLSMTAYFAALRQARDAVNVPPELTAPESSSTMTAAQIEAAFATANPSMPATAFRATCTSGMLQEARVCFTKNFAARACSASAGECPTSMEVPPVR
jgi:ribonuclease T2